MMEANFRDPKLFSKLVNKNRTKADGYTTLIIIDGKYYKGDLKCSLDSSHIIMETLNHLLLIVVKSTERISIQQ